MSEKEKRKQEAWEKFSKNASRLGNGFTSLKLMVGKEGVSIQKVLSLLDEMDANGRAMCEAFDAYENCVSTITWIDDTVNPDNSDQSETISEDRASKTSSELENKIMFILRTNPPLSVHFIQKNVVQRLQYFVTDAFMRKLAASGKVTAIPKNHGNGRTSYLYTIPGQKTTSVQRNEKRSPVPPFMKLTDC
jgi:hypothetical protein